MGKASEEPFTAVELIRTKRDGGRLTDEHIAWALDAYTRGVFADEQMAALAMAIYVWGMDEAETAQWTAAMLNSGERLRLDVSAPTVDKHSTGGVGDKITLILAPLVAACGVAVPQLSGRGLGHTGGTLDKLESIPGWRGELSTVEISRQLDEVGAVVCAATDDLAPADRKLYALRDVTGTVESIPLIASSIMSKKLAEGTSGLVLDVKCGSGAFMKTIDQARELARGLVATGRAHGLGTTALITDMSSPLGTAVGNAVEVAEAVDVLRGGGPAEVVELTVALAREMLALAGMDTADTVETDPSAVLASGQAYAVWCRMIRAQGGDPDAALPNPDHVRYVTAARTGWVSTVDAYAVGLAAWRLGAGRSKPGDAVQHAAGVRCLVRPGSWVIAGQPLFEARTDTVSALPAAIATLESAAVIVGAEDTAGATEADDTAAGGRGIVLDVLRS